MKKLFKIIFSLISIIIIFIIIALVVLFFTIRDNASINPENIDVSKHKTLEMVIDTELEKAVHNVSTTKNIDFLFDETALEYLFQSIIDGIKLEANDDIGILGVDIDVKDSKYFLEVSGKIFFYRSVLRCGLSFEEKDDSFIIHLENLKIGKLNALRIGGFVTSFIRSNKIQESLSKMGIYCEIDLKNFEVIFNNENIKKMLVESMGEEQAELVNVLSDIFLDDKDILELNLGKDDLIGAILHLQMIKYDASIKGALPYNYDFVDLKNKTKSLLENNIITTDKVSIVFDYLVNGYSVFSDDKEKTKREYINSIDLSSIGIINKESYKGILNKPINESTIVLGNSIRDSLILSLEQMIINRGFNISITDDSLTEALKTIDLIGFNYGFSNDETNDVGYLVIEQLNLICKTNQIDVYLIANINSEQIFIEIKLDTLENNNGLSLAGSINLIGIGTKELNDENKMSLLKYLNTATKDVNWLNIEIGNNVDESFIVFNFAQILNDNSKIASFMSSMAELSLSITNKTKVVDGGIIISYLN